jgi:hypothetical protein
MILTCTRHRILIATLVVVGLGCNRGGLFDSYVSGGAYYSNEPAIDPRDAAQLYFSFPSGQRGNIGAFDLKSREVTTLIDGPETEGKPRFSREGRFLAYEVNDKRRSRVMIRDRSSNLDREFSPASAFEEVRFFSPDSRQLVVRRSHFSGGLGRTCDDHVRPIDPDGPTEFVEHTVCGFSPDSSQICYSTVDSENFVWTSARDGTDDRKVAQGVFGQFLQDGELAIFNQIGKQGSVEFIDTQGNRRLYCPVSGILHFECPAYELDGRLLCVVGSETLAEPSTIIAIDITDGTVEKVMPAPPYTCSWTRASDSVFIFAYGSKAGRLWELKDGSRQATKLLDF